MSVSDQNLLCGSLAQLGEHLPYKQRVIGSIPIASTTKNFEAIRGFFFVKNGISLLAVVMYIAGSRRTK